MHAGLYTAINCLPCYFFKCRASARRLFRFREDKARQSSAARAMAAGVGDLSLFSRLTTTVLRVGETEE